MILPPDTTTSLLIRRMGALYHRLDREIGTRPLVLPDSTYFPDPFTSDEKSVRKLVRRMALHAGMADVPIRVKGIGNEHTDSCEKGAYCCGGGCHSESTPDAEAAHGTGGQAAKAQSNADSCSSGSCGSCGPVPDSEMSEPRLVDLGDSWLIQIPTSEFGHDVALTTNIAKTLGLILLLDTLPNGATIEEPIDVSAEIAGTALGFGALLLEGSYLYSKSCGGPKIGRITRLSCGELAILTALFVARGKHKSRALKRHLGTTQASAYREAEALLLASRNIVDMLTSDPGKLACGNFSLGTSTSLWDRLFGTKRSNSNGAIPGGDFDIHELEAMLEIEPSPVKRRKPRAPDVVHEELRALVDDAFAESTKDV